MKQALYATLAVTCRTHEQTATVVVDRSREDFTGAGAFMIDQQNQWDLPRATAVGGVILILNSILATSADDAPFLNESIRHCDGCIQPASGIPAQVDDQVLHALTVESP